MIRLFYTSLLTVLYIYYITGQTAVGTTMEVNSDSNSPGQSLTCVGDYQQVTHYDDISSLGPSISGDKFSLALQNLEAAAPEVEQIEGRVGDGLIQLIWINASENIAYYRIYRRDYGPSPHYSLRATVGADTLTFEDTGLDNGLPYYYKVVPVLADGTETNMIGEVTLCPMRAPVWKYISPEPVIDAVDTEIDGASQVSRPSSYAWGLGYTVSDEEGSVIKQASRASFYSDCLENPVSGIWIDRGPEGGWDSEGISDPEIWGYYDWGSYVIYSGFDGTTWRIGKITWNTTERSMSERSMILDVGPDGWDTVHVRDPYVANGGQIDELYYSGFDGFTWQIGRATWSGSELMKDSHNPVLSPGAPGEWDSAGVLGAYVTVERLYPKLYVMYYTGTDGVTNQIGYATSPDGIHWAKHVANPVLPTGLSSSWCSDGVGHPTGYDYNGETHLWYEGTDGTNTAIGHAIVHRSRIFGQHTAIFGPEWFETTAEYFNVPTIYDALYDLLIELHGFPANGADYQVMSYYSRSIWYSWNGNPYTQGIAWYSIFDYPSYPRVGSYFPHVFAHESGHNFMGYLWGTLGAIVFGNNNDYHWMSNIIESYALEKLAENYDKWGLTQEQIAQVASEANYRRGSDILSVLASEYGWGIWESFFRACRPGIIPASIYLTADTSARKNTLMICILSVACQTDLRPRFRQESIFINEIDDDFYDTIYPSVALAMGGEQNPPSAPSNLRATLKPGPRVKLNWNPSVSQDLNHYNVYSDNGTGTIDYSSPFGVTVVPWESSWTSPLLEGNRLYMFAIRAVDHWGNEEKNTSAFVFVFMPQSPAFFICDWLLLGPISNTDTVTLTTTDYTITGEANLDPFPGEVEGTKRWRRVWTPGEQEKYLPSVDANIVDLGRLLNNPSLCASYAFTRVFSPSNVMCYLRVVHDDDCRIWLNGTLVNSSGYLWGSELMTPVILHAGWNRLCLKVCNYWGGYSFSARFCDAEGGDVPGVTWSVDALGSTPVVSVAQTELVFNDVRIGENANLAINILNQGTATLAVSNIEIQGGSAFDFVCLQEEMDLAAGNGGQIIVTFAPTTLGDKSAELVATTNDPNLPTFTIRLSGLGRGSVLYVNDDSTSGDVFTTAVGNDQNSGLDPASPLRYLSTAIERFTIQNSDVIYVDSGIYYESVSIFSIDHEFTIRGAGKDLTIIDGSGMIPCLIFNAVTDVTMEQLTLQNGRGLLYEDGTRGGALLAQGSKILIRDAVLQNSMAKWGGGAFLDRGDAKLLNVTVSGNTADIDGGGVYFGSAGTLQNCVVSSNQANYGGGLYFYGSGGVAENLTVSLNVANIDGGGMFLLWGGLVRNCNINANRANGGGGAAYFYGNGGVLENSNVTLNAANSGGGLFFAWGGLTKDCEANDNSAHVDGGAAYFYGNGGILENSIVSRNKANSSGGGLFFAWGGSVQNCTVVGNIARSNGGGVYCASGGTIENTIMYSNRASSGSNYFNDGQGWSYSYCRVTPKITSGLGNIDADPRFADSGYWDPNGTPDALDDDYWIDGDYHLKSQAGRWGPVSESWVVDDVTSPCIDAGDPNSPVGDEPEPNGGRINMGAYGGSIEASKSYHDE